VEPHFPFGFGLSYTSFQISAPVIKRRRFAADDVIEFHVEVTNVGDRAGKEVVQVYIAPPAGSVPRPAKELRAFKKVELAPGETRMVGFALTRRDFEYFDENAGAWTFEGGKYEILAGAHSRSLGKAEVQIV
jgi:beta-glucosidase